MVRGVLVVVWGRLRNDFALELCSRRARDGKGGVGVGSRIGWLSRSGQDPGPRTPE